MERTLNTTTNVTLERRNSYSAWLSGFNAYQKGVCGDLVQYGSLHWRAGYYDAQAAAELADLHDWHEFMADLDWQTRGIQ